MKRKNVFFVLLGIIVVITIVVLFINQKYVKSNVRFVEEDVSNNSKTDTFDEEVTPNMLGNTVGNSSGGTGLAARDDTWVYYVNSFEGGLNRMKLDGTDRQEICADNPFNINISGGWIYYSNINDYKYYRIRPDGTKREALAEDDMVKFPQIMGEWIYFIRQGWNSESENNDYYKNIWKMRTDGSELTELCSDFCESFCVCEGKIYFSIDGDKSNIDGGVYKMDVSGENMNKISDARGSYINIDGDWIYFSNIKDDLCIYKMKTDGTELQKINDEHAEFVNVSDGWIYYSAAESNLNLYRIKIDGTDKEKLNNDKSLNICIIGDRIVYLNCLAEGDEVWSKDDHAVTIKLDGTDRRQLK